jgi:hypothetical protein
LWTERQADIDDHKPTNCHYSNYIVYQGNFTPIEWDKVVLWSEQGGLETPAGNYYSYSGRPKRNIRLFVNHWDVCLSSRSCQRVLDKRGASVHFLIDNDGTIYQTLDIQSALIALPLALRFQMHIIPNIKAGIRRTALAKDP